jgi:small subunit ribosomal protein S17
MTTKTKAPAKEKTATKKEAAPKKAVAVKTAAAPKATADKSKKFKRKLQGVVVSDKTDKTIVVKVERRYKHATYSKYLQTSKKYHVHDEKNAAKEGNTVTIIESKPYSKLKTWELLKVH